MDRELHPLTVNYPDPHAPDRRITATVATPEEVETLCLIVAARQWRAELQAQAVKDAA